MIKRTLFFGNPAYLSTKNRQMVVSFPKGEKETMTIPIEDIGYVVLEHPQITITNGLLNRLVENKTAVITCDDKRMPSGIILPYQANTLLSQRMKIQAQMSKPLRDNLWQQTIIAKISNQANLLEKLGKDGRKLRYWAKTVKSGDAQNNEAFAASLYWKELFDGEFLRDPYGFPPNNLFNYGYAILRSVASRAICSAGLHPVFGIHHKNKYNAYCLSDDIMEPYRPIVDELVMDIVYSGIDIDILTTELKAKLLIIPALDVEINKKSRPLMNAMSQTTNSLFECMVRKRRRILYPT